MNKKFEVLIQEVIHYLNGESNETGNNILLPYEYEGPDGSKCFFSTDDGGPKTKYGTRTIKNEDAVGFRLSNDEVVVADGVGGQGSDAYIASLALVKGILEREGSEKFNQEELIDAIIKAIEIINSETKGRLKSDKPSACFIYYNIDKNKLRGALMGDPQLLAVFPDNRDPFISRPDNAAQVMLERGALVNQEEYFNCPYKSVVNSSVHTNMDRDDIIKELNFFEVDLIPGTLVVTATDGLWDILDPTEVAEEIKGLNSKEAYDRITEIVIEVRDGKRKSRYTSKQPTLFDNITFHVREHIGQEKIDTKTANQVLNQEVDDALEDLSSINPAYKRITKWLFIAGIVIGGGVGYYQNSKTSESKDQSTASQVNNNPRPSTSRAIPRSASQTNAPEKPKEKVKKAKTMAEMKAELNAINGNALIEDYNNIASKIDQLGAVDFIKKIAAQFNLDIDQASSYHNRHRIFGSNYNGQGDQNTILKNIIFKELTKAVYKTAVEKNEEAVSNFKKYLLDTTN